VAAFLPAPSQHLAPPPVAHPFAESVRALPLDIGLAFQVIFHRISLSYFLSDDYSTYRGFVNAYRQKNGRAEKQRN
jgi:hypothetical protein